MQIVDLNKKYRGKRPGNFIPVVRIRDGLDLDGVVVILIEMKHPFAVPLFRPVSQSISRLVVVGHHSEDQGQILICFFVLESH